MLMPSVCVCVCAVQFSSVWRLFRLCMAVFPFHNVNYLLLVFAALIILANRHTIPTVACHIAHLDVAFASFSLALCAFFVDVGLARRYECGKSVCTSLVAYIIHMGRE